MPKRERYYVREHTGCGATEVMVIDRDYCQRVVSSTMRVDQIPGQTQTTGRLMNDGLAFRRQYAAELAGRLNREHAE